MMERVVCGLNRGDDDYYIGSTDQYYIDDNGQLYEISGKASGDHGADTASETSAGDSEDQEAEKTGELYMLADFKLQDRSWNLCQMVN